MTQLDDDNDDSTQHWQEHDDLILVAIQEVGLMTARCLDKIPCRTSPLSSRAHLLELLTGYSRRVHKVLGTYVCSSLIL